MARRLPGALRRFPVLGIRDFRLLLADRLLRRLSTGSRWSRSRSRCCPPGSTARPVQVLAAQIAPSLIFPLVGGVIADRVAPQLVIIAANVMMALGEGTFGILP